jgi:hypothetical protein
VVYQDNTSVISLITLGGVKVRTKHLRTRMFLVREAIEERKLRVKILDGIDFDFFVDETLGTVQTNQPVGVEVMIPKKRNGSSGFKREEQFERD